jgi:hypothetical protein
MRRFTMTQGEISDTREQARARFRAGHHPDVARAARDETEPQQEEAPAEQEGPSQRDLIRGLIAKQQGQDVPSQRRPALFSRGRDGGEAA